MSHILSQDLDTGRSSFTDFQNTSMSMTLGLLNVGGSATRIISRAIINQNHQHFQNVFIVQLSCAAASVVGPCLAVVSGGSTPGLRVAGTGFKQAYFDSKLVSASWTTASNQAVKARPSEIKSFFESMPGHISPANGSPIPLSIQT